MLGRRSLLVVVTAPLWCTPGALMGAPPGGTPSTTAGDNAHTVHSKDPWDYSNAERLELRFGASTKRQQSRAGEPLQTTRTLDIDGSQHPERLLPWEVFRFLMSRGYSPDKEVRGEYRARYGEAAQRLGLEGDFWTRLETAAHPYAEQLEREAELARRLRGAVDAAEREPILEKIRHNQETSCSARADALASARTEFGSQAFLRFLYESVAPDIRMTTTGLSNEPSHLEFLGRGCR